jgi:hypothetical protein
MLQLLERRPLGSLELGRAVAALLAILLFPAANALAGGMTLAAALGHNAADVGEPRTYGLEVSYRY